MRKKTQLRWLWLSLVIIVADQWVKSLVATHLALGQPYYLSPFLNFTLAENSGAAFSLLGGADGWQRILFASIGIIMSVALFVWLLKTKRGHNLQACGISLILGGAIGNLWDRLYLGYVNDFVDFHLGYWHFATFNIADTAITIGVIFLLIDLFVVNRK